MVVFAEDEAIVEKEIDNHDDDGIKGKCSGGEGEFVGKGDVEGFENVENEFVEWGKKTK